MKKFATLFHTLNGEKLQLKSLQKEDTLQVHAYASNFAVSRFIGWDLMYTPEETYQLIETLQQRETSSQALYASVVEKESGTVIGTVMLFHFDEEANQAEIGYVLHQDYWNKGYGTELINMVTNFAFQSMHLHKLFAMVVDANQASAKVLTKNGYVIEGRLRDHYQIEGHYYDCLYLGRIATN